MTARYRTLASSLEYADADISSFADLLSNLPARVGIRGMVLGGLLAGIPPEAADAIRELQSEFPSRTPFSFQPIAEFLLMLARAGELVSKDGSIREACNEVVALGVNSSFLQENPVARPLMVAGRESLRQFFIVVCSARATYINAGQFNVVGKRRNGVDLRFDFDQAGMPTAMDHIFPGGFRGVIRAFNREGEVRTVDLTDHRLEIEVDWS